MSLGFNSKTFHTLLKLGQATYGGSQDVPKRDTTTKLLDQGSLAFLQMDLRDMEVLLVDEGSFLSPADWWSIHFRLCQIKGTGPDVDFGGVCVIMMGDFMQLPPCFGPSLVRAAYRRAQDMADKKPQTEDETDQGIQLFQRCQKIEFNSQQRSKDPKHSAMLQYFRDNPKAPVSDEMLKTFQEKILCEADFAKDKAWHRAAIVVQTNATRDRLNKGLAKVYGKTHGVPVVRWKLNFGGNISHMTVDQLNAIYERNECLYAYFVQGGPAYLTVNINPSRGLANGTALIQRRLCFDTEEKQAEYQALIDKAEPGEIVTLPFAPSAVIMAVPSLPANHYEDVLKSDDVDKERDDESCLVIPVMPSKRTKKLKNSKKSRVTFYPPSFELGFAITYHKGTHHLFL